MKVARVLTSKVRSHSDMGWLGLGGRARVTVRVVGLGFGEVLVG